MKMVVILCFGKIKVILINGKIGTMLHIKADQMQNFENENFILHKSIFEPNKLIGFIKSNISWHSVEKIANTAAGI